ncbi:Sensor histidine kinase RcsC [Acaryochloris thomasi RCC1774]|uniref:histidine kinase n=1 Tax=Acaryochloris thomasi RCC1774 TaxID=1764569 RepID=A0A2W1JPQ2_9CYAN|nr:sensor histidine kinase [Acaryochloris thomasi]PZD71221.1 Sensor histidine kinase RcsC [Acaryochloris thomasi RCC1774]
MNDLGQALLKKTDTVVEAWIAAVRQDLEIESARGLSFQSVRDSIPHVLKAIATLLTSSLTDQPHTLKDKSIKHGLIRAQQGYDVAEVMREYQLLRQILFDTLSDDLQSGSAAELFEAMQIINGVFDQVISASMEEYIDQRTYEYEEIQGQLLLTNQELTRLSLAQRENLSHLSHELKNPLAAIMGFSELLLQRQQSAAGQEKAGDLKLIKRVLSNSQQLLRLINNAVEVARFDADQIELDLKEVGLVPLVQGVVDAVQPQALENIEVILDCDRAPPQVQSDSLRLQQIISNLFSNALRYTTSGSVTIICQTCGSDRWSLTVIDTGRGISPADQAHVFEPYYQAGVKEEQLPQSTGLGLAIVAKLVRLLQGDIELNSEIGVGSTFTVTFPQSVTAAHRSQ